MEHDQIISELRKQAAGVGSARAEYEAAGSAEKLAAAELLDAVVDAVRPALGAMSNRVIAAWDEETETATPATFRGLCLLGKDSPHNGLASQGIFLTEHGDLVLAKYSDGGSWNTEFELLTPRQVVEIAGKQLPAILEIIGRALAAQARGAAPRKTASYVLRAERIRAAAVLLRTA